MLSKKKKERKVFYRDDGGYRKILLFLSHYSIVCDINLESRQVRENDRIGHMCWLLEICD